VSEIRCDVEVHVPS